MRLHLAPLHGVTNRVFRDAYFRHFSGFDGAMAPFIVAVPGSEAKPRHFKDLLPGPAAEGADPDAPIRPPLAAQLLGNDPAAIAETAGVLVGLGYGEIDLNLGCPYSMVAKKRRGSGLLPFPELVGEILDALCSVEGVRASVKVRLGRFEPGEIQRLMPVLNGRPLSRVIIHPRIGIQMYRGSTDLEGFERAAGLCGHPVVYNGDIGSREAFETLAARFPEVEAWMIGRGAVANPFLPEEIKSGAVAGDRSGRLLAFHEDLYRSYQTALCGPGHLLDKMKELWSYLGSSFPAKRRQLEAIARSRSKAEYEKAAAEILGSA
jgi:tRNA-dihydrouridine synthase B